MAVRVPSVHATPPQPSRPLRSHADRSPLAPKLAPEHRCHRLTMLSRLHERTWRCCDCCGCEWPRHGIDPLATRRSRASLRPCRRCGACPCPCVWHTRSPDAHAHAARLRCSVGVCRHRTALTLVVRRPPPSLCRGRPPAVPSKAGSAPPSLSDAVPDGAGTTSTVDLVVAAVSRGVACPLRCGDGVGF